MKQLRPVEIYDPVRFQTLGLKSLREMAGQAGLAPHPPQLLVRPSGTRGKVHEVTPESACWGYVGFGLHRLGPGDAVSGGLSALSPCVKRANSR